MPRPPHPHGEGASAGYISSLSRLSRLVHCYMYIPNHGDDHEYWVTIWLMNVSTATPSLLRGEGVDIISQKM